jgi:hypothetical protein
MARYEVTYTASGPGGAGGKHVETFDAADAKEARAKAIRYRKSFGSSGSAFRKMSIRKIGD